MNCENCKSEHTGEYGSGRFCSSKCARGFSTKAKRKEINEKVSLSLTGRTLTDECKEKMSKNNCRYWKGKTRNLTDKQLKNIRESSAKLKGKKRIKECKYCNKLKEILVFGSVCNDCKGPMRVYREACRFKFNVNDYPKLFDLSLIEKFGWYAPKNSKKPNLNGISRDHIISVSYGFKNNVSPDIISHPMNCKLLRHLDNQSKGQKSKMTVEELVEKINSYL